MNIISPILNNFSTICSILVILTNFCIFWMIYGIFKLSRSMSGLTTLGAKYAGSQSGFHRGLKAVQDHVSRDILTGPQLGGIKMLADQFGFSIDDYIEEHGATQTLAGISQLLQMVGIDPAKILTEGIGGIAKDLLGKSGTTSSGNYGDKVY